MTDRLQIWFLLRILFRCFVVTTGAHVLSWLYQPATNAAFFVAGALYMLWMFVGEAK